jgi:hypothetical protein
VQQAATVISRLDISGNDIANIIANGLAFPPLMKGRRRASA